MSEGGLKWKSFTIISINFLVANENNYCLEVYLGNWAYKLVDKQVIDNLADNSFESDEH